MKVQCPKCKASYNVDEKKLPDDGINVSCQKCQNHFFIKKEIESVTDYLLDKEEKKETDRTKTVILKECPRCNLPQEGIDECQYCGFDFRNPKKKRGDSIKVHEKMEDGQKKSLNFTEGLNRIARVLAFISVLPGFLIGIYIFYEVADVKSPEYQRWEEINESMGLRWGLGDSPPKHTVVTHIGGFCIGIVFAVIIFYAVYYGFRESTKGVKSLSVWLIQGFKENKK